MDEYRDHYTTHPPPESNPPTRQSLIPGLDALGSSWPILLILLAALGLYLWLGKSGDGLGMLRTGIGGMLGGFLK